MKRSVALLLPLLFVMASCGTTAQYSQQRYSDGIYERSSGAADVQETGIYSKEDFAMMAAQQAALEAQDSLQLFTGYNDGSTTTYSTTFTDGFLLGGISFGLFGPSA